MQSTGQTSRHDSHPVQLSALMIATSFGSFLRGPTLAISKVLVGQAFIRKTAAQMLIASAVVIYFTKSTQLYGQLPAPPTKQFATAISPGAKRAFPRLR